MINASKCLFDVCKILFGALLLLSGQLSQAQNYIITTTAGSIVITDMSGNSETLNVTQNGSNIRFAIALFTRTYSLNGGSSTNMPVDIPLAGVTSIIINTAAGNDIINIGAFTANLPNLTVNGGTGNDQVNFNGSITFATNSNLDVDLQDDDASPGTDRVTVAGSANLILSGTGTGTIKVSRNVLINSGGSIETANGNLTVEANQQAVSTSESFIGILLLGGTLKVTGMGGLNVAGRGGSGSILPFQHGVSVQSGGKIEGGSGNTMVTGRAGNSTANNNWGVEVTGTNSVVASSGGDVTVTGTGGGRMGSGSNYGIVVSSAGRISAGGTGKVVVEGQGGGGTDRFNHGVWVDGASSTISSSGGDVTVKGTGGGGSGSNGFQLGVYLSASGSISAGGTGKVSVEGQGGATSGISSFGVEVNGLNSMITSSGGDVTVKGIGGGTGALSSFCHGVFVHLEGRISAGGAGMVTIEGRGGPGAGFFNYGVEIFDPNSGITSSGGDIMVTGIEGGGPSGKGIVNEFSGLITTAANGGNIVLIANSITIASSGSTNAASSTTILPYHSNVQIDLGTTSDPIGGPLGLDDGELDFVTTGTLVIGDANSGAITVSADITRPAATNVELHSAGDVLLSGGGINTGGGTLLLDPGNSPAAVKPTFTGTDATASTVSFASDLAIVINGTTPGTDYSQLTVVGMVNLTGVDLLLSGTHAPMGGQTFTIVDNDDVDPVIGTFVGLEEGAFIYNFLGSLFCVSITYLGGDGNDVVLTVGAPPLAICQDVDVQLDETGNGSTTAAAVNNGSSADCGIFDLALDPTDFTCAHVGAPQTVTLTVTDNNGNMATCTATVTVKDEIPPTITCPTGSPFARNTDVNECNYTVQDVEFDPTDFGDNCPGATIKNDLNNTDKLAGADLPKGPTTITWTVTDGMNMATATCSVTVVVTDNQPPTITCPSGSPFARNTDLNECNYTVQGVEFDPTDFGDNCPGATNKNDLNNTDKLAGADLPKGPTTITWTVTDGMNMATATCSVTVVVTDNQPPTITCPNPVTVTCASNVPAVNLASVTAMDNCPGVTKSHVGDVTTNMTCANRKTVTRSYRATDASGNSTTCAQVITVFDNVAPNFTFVPANVTVQCNSVPVVGSPTATDGCGGSVSIAYNGQTIVAGSCTDAYTITRQWTATDVCGNTKTATQRISVIDTQQPNFTSTPANVTVQCDAIPAVATPAATDNCDADVAITYNGQTTTSGACPNAYTLTRRWTAADNCGNTRSISQRITVVDNGKPFFTSFPDNTSIACNETPPAVGTPTASDGCGPATVTYLGQSTTSGSCPGTYQIRRTWRATDACGNSTAATQTIQVSDTGAPGFVTVPGPLTIECNQPLPPLVNPTASDACGGYVAITFLGNVPSGSGCAADYTVTRTWRAQDLCGNTALATQVITVQGNSYGEEGADDRVAEPTRQTTGSRPTNLALQPNPTTDRFWLDLTEFAGEAITVSIHSDLGQLVWENRISAVQDLKLQVSLREAGAAAGIYTVSVRSASGVVAKRVVLVE